MCLVSFRLHTLSVSSHSSLEKRLQMSKIQPMDSSLSDSSIYGIFQTRILEWVAISFSNEKLWGILIRM